MYDKIINALNSETCEVTYDEKDDAFSIFIDAALDSGRYTDSFVVKSAADIDRIIHSYPWDRVKAEIIEEAIGMNPYTATEIAYDFCCRVEDILTAVKEAIQTKAA